MMSLPSFETFFSFSLELISKSTALENKMKGDFKYALKRRKKKDHVSPYQQKDSLLKDISYKKENSEMCIISVEPLNWPGSC